MRLGEKQSQGPACKVTRDLVSDKRCYQQNGNTEGERRGKKAAVDLLLILNYAHVVIDSLTAVYICKYVFLSLIYIHVYMATFLLCHIFF